MGTRYYVEKNGKYMHRVYSRKQAVLNYARKLIAKSTELNVIRVIDNKGNQYD